MIDPNAQWQIITGDCLEVMKHIPAGVVGAVVTDPPYGIARVWKGGFGRGWGKAHKQTEARNAWDETPPEDGVFDGLLHLDCPMIIWGGNYFRRLPVSRGWLVWNKPERNFSLSEAELAWTNIDMVVRVFDHHRSDQGREHPTQKPVKLMEWCMSFLPAGCTVLDPYCGSGTTGVACIRTGRRFVGIELDPKFADIARRRCADAEPALFTKAEKPEEAKLWA